ncbi:MAG TPA: ATP-dependent DNA helicase RecG [Gammaproteobacteria bacterium]|nr:ATP-dependent DNA helicase RecG [Gammaproteobacteria bacterium]
MKIPTGHGTPLVSLQGVGPAIAARLEKLGIDSVESLLFHLPFRYQDRSRDIPLATLRPMQTVSVVGEICDSRLYFGRRRALLVQLRDPHNDRPGRLQIRLFHFNEAQRRQLSRGRWLRCFGEVRPGPDGPELIHPEYRLFDHQPPPPTERTLTPVYPACQGVSQQTLRKLCRQALDDLPLTLPELLPDYCGLDQNLPALGEALQFLHLPPADTDTELLTRGQHPAQQRLALEELLAHRLALLRLRQRRLAAKAPSMNSTGMLWQTLRKQLPFALTAAQQRVLNEIEADLARNRPMLRLLQGDVGCGKTIIAAAAALWALEAGYQVALMAPTELLAEQHFHNFSQWLADFPIPLHWLASGITRKQRQQLHTQLVSNQPQIVIGTHALFQSTVTFTQLGLIIVDEQHRFGVDQRLALRQKGQAKGLQPHQLIMTATPIPRTLAMTLYAELDISSIDELPPGRQTITTVAVPQSRRDEVVERVHRACQNGQQVYWVCPLIDESEVLAARAAVTTASELQAELKDLAIGLVHGRMKSAEKEAVMTRFRHHDIGLLVATTVIEVGVDVPTATLMIIENAERLGLSQLHQLRGRVGRGQQAASCVLLYQPPLGEYSRKRLTAMRETNDGFAIARRDLELRGPGEILGTRQTGLQQLRIADVIRDRALLPLVATLSAQVQQAATVDALIQRWIRDAEPYGDV